LKTRRTQYQAPIQFKNINCLLLLNCFVKGVFRFLFPILINPITIGSKSNLNLDRKMSDIDVPSNNEDMTTLIGGKTTIPSFRESWKLKNLIRAPCISKAIKSHENAKLKRVLGPIDLIGYGLGSTVGAGIFVVYGKHCLLK
jgi:hypothetical protein